MSIKQVASALDLSVEEVRQVTQSQPLRDFQEINYPNKLTTEAQRTQREDK
ncbi:hypothetical protein [Nostoc sp.]|uniref:hypothetical protein n=1 Tax=Nostoc sp. TaxID=1180 RepID=UPI002FFB85FC